VLAGAQHRQAGDAEVADVGARALGAAQAGDFLLHLRFLEKAEARDPGDQAFFASFMMIFSPE
jgi:hypothetical protein